MTTIDNMINAVSGILYQPFIVPLLLLAGGLYFTIRTGLLQIRMFPEACKVIMEKPKSENGISSFGALMVSTASRVGTGNIFGVATAICLGGPGAIFWMWITAFIGGASAFVESTLAQIYKKKNPDGSCFGGPAYYMRDALGQRWLGVIFSVLILLTYALGYNMLAAYNLQSTFASFDFYDKTTPAIIGVICAVLFGIVVLGGAKRLVHVTGLLVPIMGVAYVILALVVLVLNASNIGAMFSAIFSSAFDFQAIFGGFSGSCIMWGIKRGLYSNEAGMGSSPNAAARADVSHPVKQGLVQMLSVFIDTLLICTATAFLCLSTGLGTAGFVSDGAADAAGYVSGSLSEVFGGAGPVFLAIAMSLFAFTTLIGNYSYCESCLAFIMNRTPSHKFLVGFRVLATVIVFLGAVATAGLVWDLADMCQGLMVLCNVPVILIIGKPAYDALKDYQKQKAEGKNPEFKAADIGLKQKTDFWN